MAREVMWVLGLTGTAQQPFGMNSPKVGQGQLHDTHKLLASYL